MVKSVTAWFQTRSHSLVATASVGTRRVHTDFTKSEALTSQVLSFS